MRKFFVVMHIFTPMLLFWKNHIWWQYLPQYFYAYLPAHLPRVWPASAFWVMQLLWCRNQIFPVSAFVYPSIFARTVIFFQEVFLYAIMLFLLGIGVTIHISSSFWSPLSPWSSCISFEFWGELRWLQLLMGPRCGKLTREENLLWAFSQTSLANRAFLCSCKNSFSVARVVKKEFASCFFQVRWFFSWMFSRKWTRRCFTWKFSQGQVIG